MKRLAEIIVAIYLGLGELSFIISIKFGLIGIIVLIWNLDTYLRGQGSNITLGVAIGVGAYTLITFLPWLAGGYLKIVDGQERSAKRKNPQFLSIVEQKICARKKLDHHEEEFITENVTRRLASNEDLKPEVEAYYLLRNEEAFDELLFHASDARFRRMFEYFARTLNDNGLMLIFTKIPTRMNKFIQSGEMSTGAFLRLQTLFKSYEKTNCRDEYDA